MNIKRYLKEQAEQERPEDKELLERNEERFQALKAELQLGAQPATQPEKKRRRWKTWLPALCSGVAAAVILTVTLTVFPLDKTVEYKDKNAYDAPSTLEELNNATKEFDFQIDTSLYTCNVTKTIDSVSNDILYYSTIVTSIEDYIEVRLITVCNPNYKYKNFNFTTQPITESFASYTVEYESKIVANTQFDIDTLEAKAKIQKGKETVYVTEYFEALLTDTDGSFLEILQSVVK